MCKDALEEGASLISCVSKEKEWIDTKKTLDRKCRGLRINLLLPSEF